MALSQSVKQAMGTLVSAILASRLAAKGIADGSHGFSEAEVDAETDRIYDALNAVNHTTRGNRSLHANITWDAYLLILEGRLKILAEEAGKR